MSTQKTIAHHQCISWKRQRNVAIVGFCLALGATVFMFATRTNFIGGGAPIATADAQKLISNYDALHGQPYEFVVSRAELAHIMAPPAGSTDTPTHLHLAIDSSAVFFGNSTVIFAGSWFDAAGRKFKNVGWDGKNDYYLQHIFPVYDGKVHELDRSGRPTGGEYDIDPL